MLVAGETYAEVAEELAERPSSGAELVLALDDHPRGYERWLAGHEARDPGARGDARDVVLQMYTSGTTGTPKGVLTTHRNLAAAAETSPHWAFDADSVSMTPLPMFHIGGIGWAFLGLWNGATTVLVRDFVPELVLDILEHQRVTNAVLVPTMLKLLADVPGAAERDYSSLRSIAYGASPITTPVLKAALRTFRCAALRHLRPDRVHGRNHPSSSRPITIRMARASISCAPPAGRSRGSSSDRRPGDGRRARRGRGRRGVAARAERHAGYYERPAETAAALTPDGWLRTGDGGYVDAARATSS